MPPQSASPLPTLDIGYYLRNFWLIIDAVLARDRHLFDALELARLDALRALPEPSIRLYIRLFNRRGPYFRLSRLRYEEIPDIVASAELLEKSGFMTRVSGLTEAERELLLPLYTVEELKLRLPRQPGRTDRNALLTQARALDGELLRRLLLEDGPVVGLLEVPLIERFQRLFFLNGQQDATTLVTADLALVRYPSYPLTRSRPVFADRAAFEAYLEALAHREAYFLAGMEQAEELRDSLGESALQTFLALPPVPEGFLARYAARTVYARTSVDHLRRRESTLGREASAQAYLQLLERGLPARLRGETWCRLALNAEKGLGAAAAVALCEAGLAEPSTRQGARVELERRLETLRRRLSGQKGRGSRPEPVDAGEGEPLREVVVRRPLHSSGLYQRIRFLGADGVELTVEALAIAAYRAVGCEAVYTENVVFTTLFGILCWDVLFAEVPDVFQTPFQIAPLDLNTEGFFEARQALFAARLESLRVDPVPVLRAHHAAYFGLAAQGVAWEVYPLAVLEQICLRLGGERLSLLMRALAEDYGKRRRGLPDLLVWVSGEVDSPELFWEQLPYEPPAAVFFAEVKSPRDRLSVEQRAWISTLSTLGLPVEVCRVEVGQTL